MKPLLRIACVITLSLAFGCGDACLSLAQQVCSCQPDQVSVDACNSRAQTAEGIFPVTSSDQKNCQSLLDARLPDGGPACNCVDLTTSTGRTACGIALH